MRKAMLAMGLLTLGSTALAKTPDATRVAALAKEAMASTGARGLAVAVIDDGKVASVQAFGERNAKGEPLTVDTIMYGASLTKAVFAYTLMQLAGEGKVSLDRPIGEYFAKPLPEYGNLDAYGNWADLAGDERWRQITPRILLTHSSGFRNFSWDEPDQKLRINFAPGSRYSYSGEGIILLQ
jgi:CubicO group peptidase (beta-lactamase class C family)